MKFTKVFVSEDIDSNNLGIVTTIRQFGISEIGHSQFCDDTLWKIRNTALNGDPYQLLISDLSYEDGGNSKISSGQELIAEVKKVVPNIKIIVFSQFDQQSIIKPLLEEQNIDGYVCKGINGLKELKKGIESVAEDKKYTCPVATASLRKQNIVQLTNFQQQLLMLLAEGNKQSQISEIFIEKNVEPNSVRSIETNISKLKDAFNAATTTQLVYLASNFGLI